VTLERARSPVALRPAVRPHAFAFVAVTVISPPKSETVCASPEALALARVPASLCAETPKDPTVATEPSAGYAKPLPNETWYGGAETAPAVAPVWPGTTTRIANAFADAPAVELDPPAPAEPAAKRSKPPRSTQKQTRFRTVERLLTIARTDSHFSGAKVMIAAWSGSPSPSRPSPSSRRWPAA
jgi:hypothetical protein